MQSGLRSSRAGAFKKFLGQQERPILVAADVPAAVDEVARLTGSHLALLMGVAGWFLLRKRPRVAIAAVLAVIALVGIAVRGRLPRVPLFFLLAAGGFLDLMQWRVNRSAPVGMADDGYVLEYRNFDEGKNPFSWNIDRKTMTPLNMFDAGKVGVVVERCDVYSEAPRQQKVRDAFLNVLNAEITRNRKLDDARSFENQVLSRASAEAVSLTNAAETARIQMVSLVAGEATNFSRLLPRYQANPDLFVQQRLMETLGRALTNLEERIYIQERADGKPRELRLLFNREMPASTVQTNQ